MCYGYYRCIFLIKVILLIASKLLSPFFSKRGISIKRLLGHNLQSPLNRYDKRLSIKIQVIKKRGTSFETKQKDLKSRSSAWKEPSRDFWMTKEPQWRHLPNNYSSFNSNFLPFFPIFVINDADENSQYIIFYLERT